MLWIHSTTLLLVSQLFYILESKIHRNIKKDFHTVNRWGGWSVITASPYKKKKINHFLLANTEMLGFFSFHFPWGKAKGYVALKYLRGIPNQLKFWLRIESFDSQQNWKCCFISYQSIFACPNMVFKSMYLPQCLKNI